MSKPSYEHLLGALLMIREELPFDDRGSIPLSVAYSLMATRMKMIAEFALAGEEYEHIQPKRSGDMR